MILYKFIYKSEKGHECANQMYVEGWPEILVQSDFDIKHKITTESGKYSHLEFTFMRLKLFRDRGYI